MVKRQVSTAIQLKAIANENRLKILEWMLDPEQHFPPQQDGDLVDDGVCIGFITNKIGLSQPSVTAHMRTLAKAGLVNSKQIKNWIFYRPDREAIAALLSDLAFRLLGENEL